MLFLRLSRGKDARPLATQRVNRQNMSRIEKRQYGGVTPVKKVIHSGRCRTIQDDLVAMQHVQSTPGHRELVCSLTTRYSALSDTRNGVMKRNEWQEVLAEWSKSLVFGLFRSMLLHFCYCASLRVPCFSRLSSE